MHHTLADSDYSGAEQVTILERQAEAGRKILVSGGTRWCAASPTEQGLHSIWHLATCTVLLVYQL